MKGSVTLLNKHLKFSIASEQGSVYSRYIPNWRHYKQLFLKGEAVYFGQNANIHVQQLTVHDDHLNGDLAGYVLLRHHVSPHLSLLGHFTFNNTQALKNYLPSVGLSVPLRQWLNQAFQGGSLNQGRILWRGRLKDFPYLHHHGRFSVSAKLSDFSLKFSPTWPAIQSMQGDLSFINNGMYLHSSTLGILKNKLSGLTATIKDFHRPRLVVDASTKGRLSSVLSVLRSSPLPLGRRLKGIQATGKYHGHLTLKVNLNDVDHTLVKKAIAFSG